MIPFILRYNNYLGNNEIENQVIYDPKNEICCMINKRSFINNKNLILYFTGTCKTSAGEDPTRDESTDR